MLLLGILSDIVTYVSTVAAFGRILLIIGWHAILIIHIYAIVGDYYLHMSAFDIHWLGVSGGLGVRQDPDLEIMSAVMGLVYISSTYIWLYLFI